MAKRQKKKRQMLVEIVLLVYYIRHTTQFFFVIWSFFLRKFTFKPLSDVNSTLDLGGRRRDSRCRGYMSRRHDLRRRGARPYFAWTTIWRLRGTHLGATDHGAEPRFKTHGRLSLSEACFICSSSPQPVQSLQSTICTLKTLIWSIDFQEQGILSPLLIFRHWFVLCLVYFVAVGTSLLGFLSDY